jgi:hypothetical protein
VAQHFLFDYECCAFTQFSLGKHFGEMCCILTYYKTGYKTWFVAVIETCGTTFSHWNHLHHSNMKYFGDVSLVFLY